jgi:hypothetical protein
MQPEVGCPPISHVAPNERDPAPLRIADSSGCDDDMPGMPGWPEPGCPIDPNKPGGASAKPCTPPKET